MEIYFAGGLMTNVTRILNAIEQGDLRAADELLPIVYEQLRLLAAQKLSAEPPGQTLQPTALVHEAYLRLIGPENPDWDNRSHFFAAAAEAMRRILIENARRKKTLKYGGDRQKVDLDHADLLLEGPSDDLLALDEALTRLAAQDPLKADLVKLRYFTGLTIDQAASALKISRATAIRHWSFARAWLYQQINPDE